MQFKHILLITTLLCAVQGFMPKQEDLIRHGIEKNTLVVILQIVTSMLPNRFVLMKSILINITKETMFVRLPDQIGQQQNRWLKEDYLNYF